MSEKKILFTLNEDQLDALHPLFCRVYLDDNPGAILLQPFSSGKVYGNYIPRKYAVRINKILKEIKSAADTH